MVHTKLKLRGEGWGSQSEACGAHVQVTDEMRKAAVLGGQVKRKYCTERSNYSELRFKIFVFPPKYILSVIGSCT